MLLMFVVAAVLVAVAELGDKTQMLTLVLASRYPASAVLAGVVGAVLVLQLIATTAGSVVGALVPERLLALLTAAVFVGFGVWSLCDARVRSVEEDVRSVRHRWGPAVMVAVAFFLAEIGDKTQVLTFAVAADPGAAMRVLEGLGLDAGAGPEGAGAFLGVWLGSALGMMAVNGLAILAGSAIGRRVPRHVVAAVTGVLFILIGLTVLFVAYLG